MPRSSTLSLSASSKKSRNQRLFGSNWYPFCLLFLVQVLSDLSCVSHKLRKGRARDEGVKNTGALTQP
jgi:hypothetical protein